MTSAPIAPIPAASVGVAAPNRMEPSTKIIRISGGAALFIRAGNGTLGKSAGGASFGFASATAIIKTLYSITRINPGMMAPANKSPTEIDLGLKMPSES